MNKDIVILDYGVGNVGSVTNSLAALGYSARVSSSVADIDAADLLVLPGQGAFETAMRHLHEGGFSRAVIDYIQAGRKFLGICVGFQVLFEGSEEKGSHDGLGIFPGRFREFDKSAGLSVPHMGWNSLSVRSDLNEVFENSIENFVYFVHSYFMPASDDEFVSATCDYGEAFVAVVQRENLLAMQFHPEKSGDVGLGILRRFLGRVL